MRLCGCCCCCLTNPPYPALSLSSPPLSSPHSTSVRRPNYTQSGDGTMGEDELTDLVNAVHAGDSLFPGTVAKALVSTRPPIHPSFQSIHLSTFLFFDPCISPPTHTSFLSSCHFRSFFSILLLCLLFHYHHHHQHRHQYHHLLSIVLSSSVFVFFWSASCCDAAGFVRHGWERDHFL